MANMTDTYHGDEQDQGMTWDERHELALQKAKDQYDDYISEDIND